MIYSMTGFGKTSIETIKNSGLVIEISSVNRKQLEIRFNLPRELTSFENEFRKMIANKIGRGMVSVRVSLEQNMKQELDKVNINQNLLKALLKSAVEAKKELNLEENIVIDIASLYNVNGVISNENVDLDNSELLKKIELSTQSALDNFLQSRYNEGVELINDLAKRIEYLKNLLEKIIPFTKEIKENLSKKIMNKLKEENFVIDLNDDRLQKEILFYVDKSDVTEEIIRLKSHFIQFDKLMDKDSETPGRSMDFLLQEMFREINTLGNKSGNCGVSPLVVKFKTELEKIREQCQNIE